MGISVSGLASGLDVDGIISQLLNLETQQIIGYNRKIAVLEAKKAAYEDVDSRLTTLSNAVKKLNDNDLFGELDAQTSDPTVVTVKATDEAPEGTYKLKVLQLATNHRLASNGFIDSSASAVAAGDGTLVFKVGGGADVTVDVTGTTTLRQLADAINAKDAGVSASVVNDGTATNPYRLVLTAEESGDAGRISIVNNDTSLELESNSIEQAVHDAGNAADYTGVVTSSGAYTGADNTSFVVRIITAGQADGTAKFEFSADGGLTFDDNGGAGYDATSAGPIVLADGVEVNFTDDGSALQVGDEFSIDVFSPELEAPQDAVLDINGIQVRKSSNTIDDIFDGLEFSLNSAEPNKTVTLTVAQKVGDVTSAMGGFIGAYNALVGFLGAQFSYDPESNEPIPALNGDSAARQIQRTVKTIITSRVGQLGGDSLSSLAEVGLTSNEQTGLASLDASKLDAALKEDPQAVRRLLTRFGEALDGSNFTYLRRTSSSQEGTYDVEVTQARTRAEVNGGIPAENLSANENLTIGLNSDAQNPAALPQNVNVALLAGDTPAQQVARIQGALDSAEVGITAYIDAGGAIRLRSDEYGEDFEVLVQSDRAAGVGLGTTGFGNVQVSDTGTDLEGTIGGREAEVLDGNHLKGKRGFDVEGIELIIPDDTSGDLGRVRIVNGLGESLPGVLRELGLSGGILASRRDGVNKGIEEFESQIERQGKRIEQVETRLRRQFTNLEVQLSQINALGDYVTQQLSALNNSKKK